MDARNYASLEASRRLVEAGIVLEIVPAMAAPPPVAGSRPGTIPWKRPGFPAY